MPMMTHDAEAPVPAPAESNEATPPCHDARPHEAPAPVAPAEAPCAPDDCCAFRAPTAPHTEKAPELASAPALLLTAVAGVLPLPVTGPDPAPSSIGASPPTVPFSILYGCFLT